MSNLHLGGGYFTNKNVKAFTLIELLAVIIILSIIALIATPIILGIIGETKEKAFKLSLKNAEHAYEIYEVQHNIKPGTEVNIKDLPLDSKLSGTILTNEEGKVELKNVTDGTYSASGPVDDISMIKGTPEDLLKNILTVKVNTNYSSRNIVVTVDVIEGIPTSYSYKIEGPDNYKQGVNNVTSNNQTFNKLKPNMEYKVTVTVKNKAGLTKEIVKTGKTLSIDSITLDLTPKDEYIKEGKIKITYPNIESELENKYKWSNEEEFTKVSGNSIEVPAKNGTLIAIVSDGEEVITQNSITINNVDNIGPEITSTDVNNEKVTIIASDDMSGLNEKSYNCNGTWQASNVCTFTTSGTYTIKVRDKLENETSKEITLTNYQDSTGSSQPVLGGLIPVVYRNNNWEVANQLSKWYDYEKQEWANAALLKPGVLKSVGQTVNVESEVQGMFVWIPRYEYKIDGTYGKGGTSASSPGEIEVNFISKSITYTNTNGSGYRVHPAFNFGGKELDGIWMGKFETTGTEDNPTILPSQTSLRSRDRDIKFEISQKIKVTNMDSHTSKNSEWGAAAYLSQSKYGKYGNINYTGANKEVMINNCSKFITGIGANSQNEGESSTTCTANIYTTSKGQAASTTGNITGIYDMNGGSMEFVMAIYDASRFSSLPDEKYYDNYPAEASSTACTSVICYGHALSETSGWYGDNDRRTAYSNPYSKRGGDYYYTSDAAGVFASNIENDGKYGSNSSFRVVLAQTT